MKKVGNIILKNNRLEVNMGCYGRTYKKSRFDHTGFVTQVTLDNKHTFCVRESLDDGGGTGGQGLCNEFDISNALGFEECEIGEKFVKIGVGLLTRPDDRSYAFYRDYEVTPFKVNIMLNKYNNRVRFVTKPTECRDIAVHYTKTLSIVENYLIIEYELCNSGRKSIASQEYCHNFIGIDGYKVDSSYTLKLPYEVQLHKDNEKFDVRGEKLTWRSSVKKPFYGKIKVQSVQGEVQWELLNSKAGAGVREYDNFKVSDFALWGDSHVVSPETFIMIDLEPGNSKKWTRRYEFFEV